RASSVLVGRWPLAVGRWPLADPKAKTANSQQPTVNCQPPTANMDNRGFFETLLTGPALLVTTALILMGCGAFALFQAATGQFLPHDVDFPGLTAQQLCTLRGCRVVHFMMHDRVSFGGVLLAIGVMYLWLTEFPLRRGESWAWWAILASGVAGFLSFLAYLGYGYLDTWHGVATLALAPIF